jgi:hypothetical protein
VEFQEKAAIAIACQVVVVDLGDIVNDGSASMLATRGAVVD